MVYHFPNLALLAFCVRTHQLPDEVVFAPVQSHVTDSGTVQVESAVELPKSCKVELTKLGVHFTKPALSQAKTYAHWLEMLPLEKQPFTHEPGTSRPILFDLPADKACEMSTEILRQGNDRQSLCWYHEERTGSARVLLQVISPPYYSLLRALECEKPGSSEVRAYRETSPRVWQALGYLHPLSESLHCPEGKLLLLTAEHDWVWLAAAPFRDLYLHTKFTLPQSPTAYADTSPSEVFTIPLSLTRAGAGEEAELWVLRANALAQVEAFLAETSDEQIHRLAFAVLETAGEPWVILKLRPGLGRPLLLTIGEAYRCYLKIPNLFLPVGSRLQPPLRREAVKQLLAAQPDRLSWLAPEPGSTKFRVETVPLSNFLPLADWVEYVIDRAAEPLASWVQAHRFAFEAFSVADDAAAAPRPPDVGAKAPRTKKGSARGSEKAGTSATFVESLEPVPTQPNTPAANESVRATKPDLVACQARLREVEEAFLSTTNSAEREAYWPELARLNTRLGRLQDAGLCWLNAVWSPEPPTPALVLGWLQSQALALAPRAPARQSWLSPLDHEPTADGNTGFEQLLSLPNPTQSDLLALCAYLLWASQQEKPADWLVERQARLQRFVEQHEALLPLQAVWLIWQSLTQLAGGDVLALARCRDRLLQRLLQAGLRPELDAPNFLRFAGKPESERYRAASDWLQTLHQQVQGWLARMQTQYPVPDTAQTPAYVKLYFAYALGKLGSGEASRELQRQAESVLLVGDEVHSWLCQAYAYRIEQARQSKPHAGPLPTELMLAYQALVQTSLKDKTNTAQKIDYLRNHSRLLEPIQQTDPFRHILAGQEGELGRELSALVDSPNLAELAGRFQHYLGNSELLNQLSTRRLILRAGLEQASRLGDSFAQSVLALVPDTLSELTRRNDAHDWTAADDMLRRSLFLAVHFDMQELIPGYLQRFDELLDPNRPERKHVLELAENTAVHTFRLLSRLGRRDVLDHLSERIVTVLPSLVQEPTLASFLQSLTANPGRRDPLAYQGLSALLYVASHWLYVGRPESAEPVLTAARAVLCSVGPTPESNWMPRRRLTLAYLQALTHLPFPELQSEVASLFAHLHMHDQQVAKTHFSWFQLVIVETLLQTVCSDDFTAGSTLRRWLDEAEFTLRQRLHRAGKQWAS